MTEPIGPSYSCASPQLLMQLMTVYIEYESEQEIFEKASEAVRVSSEKLNALCLTIAILHAACILPEVASLEETSYAESSTHTDKGSDHAMHTSLINSQVCSLDEICPQHSLGGSNRSSSGSVEVNRSTFGEGFYDTLLQFEASCLQGTFTPLIGARTVPSTIIVRGNRTRALLRQTFYGPHITPVRLDDSPRIYRGQLDFSLPPSPQLSPTKPKQDKGCIECSLRNKPLESLMVRPLGKKGRYQLICHGCIKKIITLCSGKGATDGDTLDEQLTKGCLNKADSALLDRALVLRGTDKITYNHFLGHMQPANQCSTVEIRGYLQEYAHGTFAPDAELMATFNGFLGHNKVKHDQNGPATAKLLSSLLRELRERHKNEIKSTSDRRAAQIAWQARTIASMSDLDQETPTTPKRRRQTKASSASPPLTDAAGLASPAQEVDVKAILKAEGADAPAASRKAKPIKLKLDRPHPAPTRWQEQWRVLTEQRKTIIAPVDTMGCDKAGRNLKDIITPRDDRYQTLISLMLSSQTKDQVTDEAASNLRDRIPGGFNIESILAASDEQISSCINKVGFWRRKTDYIRRTSEMLRDLHDSDVPKTIQELCDLPGVGPKMGFLSLQSQGINGGIGVDTHVHRITHRLRWHRKEPKDAEETRLNLESWLPSELHGVINKTLVGFGQAVCLPVGPRCDLCDLGKASLCPSRVKVDTLKRSPSKYLAKQEIKIDDDALLLAKEEDIKPTLDDLKPDTVILNGHALAGEVKIEPSEGAVAQAVSATYGRQQKAKMIRRT
ncbi:hypothetical protein E5Q_01385 [Mixia osmundae IAM 14324]|uniref:Endonuclease III homolog n=1 Tax=Mixia osmundae (strain CBS 9802 / IAM 14324 / JCM 22182 / KY 12970) TaxID=764103 RepID=G7DVX1_MIXOS|nr:hypothetical protein E5Q_01385 [Mixia osmundae IAM 14324]